MTKQVAIITGASSEGYTVVLAARRMERLAEVAGEIEAQGGEAMAVETDLQVLEQIEALVNHTLERYGRVDALFNNAGFGRFRWLEELDPQKGIASQLNVNLSGLIQLTRAVLPHMIAQRSGAIINMGSVAGLVGTPTYSVYAASKFGLRGFSEALRREVSVYGISVSVIYAGGVATEFSSHTGAQRKTGLSTPQALLLQPEDIARTVLGLIRRPRRQVIMPWVMVFSVWANMLFPGLVDWLIERSFTRPERGLE
jgi:short-subunit dehydrogenase